MERKPEKIVDIIENIINFWQIVNLDMDGVDELCRA